MAAVSTEVLREVSAYFKVLSEVSRLEVLCALKEGRRNVGEIVTETGLGQANVSKHLKVLAQAGFVSREPEGVSVYYAIVDPVVFQLCELVCAELSERLAERGRQAAELKAAGRGI